METTEQKKVEIELPADLAKRFSEATTPEARNQVLSEFAASRGAEDVKVKEAAIFSDEQFRAILDKVGTVSADQAKAVISEIASENERKYNLNPDKAKEVAERTYESIEQRMLNQRADWETASKVFRGIYLAKMGKPDAYQRAIEEEAAYNKRVYNRETRAMVLGTDSTGGYLAPQGYRTMKSFSGSDLRRLASRFSPARRRNLFSVHAFGVRQPCLAPTQFSDRLIENLARTSIVRRFATIIPMNGNEIIKFPKVTSGLSAAKKAENAEGTSSQPVFTQVSLATEKLMTITRPVSIEMLEKANPAIVPLLLKWGTMAINNLEDELVFGTTGNGIRASAVNEVVGPLASAGYAGVDFDHLADLEGELEPQYTPDEDIQSSGQTSSLSQFFIAHKLRHELHKKKNGVGEYLDESRELRNSKKIFGYNARRVLSLPNGSSLSANDKVAIFGDLGWVWCGIEPGIRLQILDQAVIDDGGGDVNLAKIGAVGIRLIEFFSNVVADDEAFSQLKLG